MCCVDLSCSHSIPPGISLRMRPVNERLRYIVTPSLIGWAHTQNDPCATRHPVAKPLLNTNTATSNTAAYRTFNHTHNAMVNSLLNTRKARTWQRCRASCNPPNFIDEYVVLGTFFKRLWVLMSRNSLNFNTPFNEITTPYLIRYSPWYVLSSPHIWNNIHLNIHKILQNISFAKVSRHVLFLSRSRYDLPSWLPLWRTCGVVIDLLQWDPDVSTFNVLQKFLQIPVKWTPLTQSSHCKLRNRKAILLRVKSMPTISAEYSRGYPG